MSLARTPAGATAGASTWQALRPSALVRDNQVISNAANSVGLGKGGGLAVQFGDGTVQDNLFRDNLAAAGSNGMGGGVYLYDSSAVISGNVLRGNRANLTASGFGGAIYVEFEEPTLIGNVVISSTAQFGAICIAYTPQFTMTNNVVAQNVGDGVVVKGNASYPVAGTLLHNTIAQNGEHGVYVGYYNSVYATLTLTNNIIVIHTVGIDVYEPQQDEPNRATASHTLFFGNGSDTAGGIITSTHEITGSDPLFVNPAAFNFHIQRHSPAIDAGTDAGVFTDLDGDLRPMGAGPDIGADEWRWLRLFLPAVLRQ